MSLTEAQTRADHINRQLLEAGWDLSDHTQVALELPVPGYDAGSPQGFTDYCLFQPNGQVIAVIEAKRFSREPREGEEQLRQYLQSIEGCQHR